MFLGKVIEEIGTATNYPKFNGESSTNSELKTIDLFLAQYNDGEFNALDVVVKFLAIENYYGKNEYGAILYRKMQVNRVGEDWTSRFLKLIKSFEKGFNRLYEIETDLSYSIHDGAHRLALSLYHGCDLIPVRIFNVNRKRKYYGVKWFKENNFNEKEISLINIKLQELLAFCRRSYFGILWTPARHYFEDIVNCINQMEGIHLVKSYKIQFTRKSLERFIYKIYETDDIRKEKLDIKFQCILNSLKFDNYRKESFPVLVVEVKLDDPDYRFKPISGLPQSCTTMRVKKVVREAFKDQITGYYHDIIMHFTDNQIQNDAVRDILRDFQVHSDEKGKEKRYE